MKNRCLGLVISQYLFEGGRNKRVDDVLNLPNFCLFIYKLGLNISFSQAFWEDQIMPGQQITHCWKQRKETGKCPTIMADSRSMTPRSGLS